MNSLKLLVCISFLLLSNLLLSQDCEFNVQINQQSCSGYNLFSVEQEYLDWYINDEFQTTSLTFDFYPDTAGTYEICAVNEGCPPETNFCETFVITEDCFSDCNINIESIEYSCDTYNFFETNGQNVSWYINDEFISFFHGMDFDPTEPGTYEICASYETEDCLQGVTVCDTLIISEDCFDIISTDNIFQEREIIIRPNITQSDFRIDGLSESCIIHVIDQNGKIVFQTTGNGGIEVNCDISNLIPGLYYISILNSENKLQRNGKILKI